MDLMIVVIFLAGLVLGTLLNIVVIRLPRERKMGGWPRCTRCGRPLAVWQLLPSHAELVISAQRTNSRYCAGALLCPLWLQRLILLSGVCHGDTDSHRCGRLAASLNLYLCDSWRRLDCAVDSLADTTS